MGPIGPMERLCGTPNEPDAGHSQANHAETCLLHLVTFGPVLHMCMHIHMRIHYVYLYMYILLLAEFSHHRHRGL